MAMSLYRRLSNQRDYDRGEDPIYVHLPIALAVLSILGDRLITITFWSYEANPLVSSVGMGRWLALTVVLVVLLPVAWYGAMGFESRLVRALMWLVCALHSLAVVTNALVILGLY